MFSVLLLLSQGMGMMIIAGAVSEWYWTPTKKGAKKGRLNELLASAKRTVCNHMGTVIYGSFIIALVQFIRAVIMPVTYNIYSTPLPTHTHSTIYVSNEIWKCEATKRMGDPISIDVFADASPRLVILPGTSRASRRSCARSSRGRRCSR